MMMQSIVWWQQLSPRPLVLLPPAYFTPCPYHYSGVGGGMGDGVGNGGGSGRQQLSSKWRGAPALKGNANCNGMDEGGEWPKTKHRKININATFYAIVASDSAESMSLLSCLSSALVGYRVASCLPPPQLLVASSPPVQRHLHLSTSCCTATSHLALLLLWCSCLLFAPSGCYFTSCHAAASIHLRLCLSLHHRLSLHPSHATCLSGCCITNQHIVHKHNKKGSYCKFFGSLTEELIDNTQGICMMKNFIKNQAAKAMEAAKPIILKWTIWVKKSKWKGGIKEGISQSRCGLNGCKVYLSHVCSKCTHPSDPWQKQFWFCSDLTRGESECWKEHLQAVHNLGI